MGYHRVGWIAAVSLVLAGCATTGPAPHAVDGEGLGDARWVETEPDVRTLLVSPLRVGPVARPGEDAADLAIGSFFARYESPDGPHDQLALMVVIEGESAPRVLASGRSLLLEIDGEFFQGRPGLGSNSMRWEPSNGGRATLVIPISPEILQSLANAEHVRGRIGAFGTFEFPDARRARLADLLRGLPDDYRVATDASSVQAKISSM